MAAVQKSENLCELVAEIAGTIGGVEVRGRCFSFTAGYRRRHEIHLQAGRERAIVDVPRGVDPKELLRKSLAIFTESLAARR
jgi:hypothetical protein